ncbi:F-box protein At3g07870-like [Papaver somniferum]|uniref:F-box protein At3g07870-like n=1 Tax=Papaver somniferum TaxID=3469 RepID=UPI000E6FB3AD|nr:F-box protein At3g07870-like [Papaver somniferum]
MEVLPKDIISGILSRVTPDSILTCKLVCKSWKTLLTHVKVGVLFMVQSTEEKQLGFYYGDFDELIGDCGTFKTTAKKINHLPIVKGGNPLDYEMVGSCNGLVCLYVPYADPIYICNPVTGEYVYLPNLDRKVHNIAGGFGYLRTLDVYKVVRIYYPVCRGRGFVQIYTLGNCRGWREIGEIEHCVDSYPGVLANEILYFRVDRENNILALDLASEEFYMLPKPSCLSECNTTKTYQLKVMRGYLCIVLSKKGENVEIWSLQNNCSSIEKNCDSRRWSLDYSMPWFGHPCNFFEPVAFTKSNKLLVWCNVTTLCCYDPQTRNLRSIVEYDVTFDTIPHINSSVSLKSLGMEERIKEIEEDPSKRESSKGILELPICTMYDDHVLGIVHPSKEEL